MVVTWQTDLLAKVWKRKTLKSLSCFKRGSPEESQTSGEATRKYSGPPASGSGLKTQPRDNSCLRLTGQSHLQVYFCWSTKKDLFNETDSKREEEKSIWIQKSCDSIKLTMTMHACVHSCLHSHTALYIGRKSTKSPPKSGFKSAYCLMLSPIKINKNKNGKCVTH